MFSNRCSKGLLLICALCWLPLLLKERILRVGMREVSHSSPPLAVQRMIYVVHNQIVQSSTNPTRLRNRVDSVDSEGSVYLVYIERTTNYAFK